VICSRVVGLCLVAGLGGLVAGCGANKSGNRQETVTVQGHVLTVEKLTTIKRPPAMDSIGDGWCVRYGNGPSGDVYRCADSGASGELENLRTGEAAGTMGAKPVNLSRSGRILWQFEALLRDTFGNRLISVHSARPGSAINFACASRIGCKPLADWSPYVFKFRSPATPGFIFRRGASRRATSATIRSPSWSRAASSLATAQRRGFLSPTAMRSAYPWPASEGAAGLGERPLTRARIARAQAAQQARATSRRTRWSVTFAGRPCSVAVRSALPASIRQPPL
jgi:hypothetical protein